MISRLLSNEPCKYIQNLTKTIKEMKSTCCRPEEEPLKYKKILIAGFFFLNFHFFLCEQLFERSK